MEITNTYSYLATIIGYPQHMPEAPVTRYHYIDDRKPDRLINYGQSRIVVDSKQLTDFQRRTLYLLDKHPNMTKEDLAKMECVSDSHAGIVLTALYKANLINRHKITRNKKWAYVYTGKSK